MSGFPIETGFVPLSHALRVGQWDKGQFSGTTGGTATGLLSLKALAYKVLDRDSQRDNSGTSTANEVGQEHVQKGCFVPPQNKPVPQPDALHRLAGVDTNIAALLGWGLTPHLESGALVIAGLDALNAESRDGLARWLDHRNTKNEPRSERIAHALQTGRCCTC